MIIELKAAIDEYEKVTNQEINNIKKIDELKLDSIKVEKKKKIKIRKTEKKTNERIQNIIKYNKEISQRIEKIEPLTAETTKCKNQTKKMQPSIIKAVLLDKYRYNWGKLATNNKRINVYPISILWSHNRAYYYILYWRRWQLLSDIVTALKNKWIIYVRRYIINVLKKYQRRNKYYINRVKNTDQRRNEDPKARGEEPIKEEENT